VPRLYEHRYAYIFQQPDRRIVFAIPYEREFTLIGTTDVDYHGDPSHPRIDAAEVAYLCDAVNRYFKRAIAPGDVVWSYSGVRPLLDDESGNASEVTRDYLLEIEPGKGAPLLNVFGGKLTTYRKLAEEAVDRLAPLLGNEEPAWTGKGHPLPGGDIQSAERLAQQLRATRPWMSEAMAWRLAHTYGSQWIRVIGDATSLAGLGEHFGADLYASEVEYLRRYEWAGSAEDVLWRRTKLGLHVGAEGAARLAAYFARGAAAGAT
jgi:glycerol-3-phosphate dehydrogenase